MGWRRPQLSTGAAIPSEHKSILIGLLYLFEDFLDLVHLGVPPLSQHVQRKAGVQVECVRSTGVLLRDGIEDGTGPVLQVDKPVVRRDRPAEDDDDTLLGALAAYS